MIKSLNDKIQDLENQKQNLNTEIAQLKLQQSALTASYKQPVENRSFEALQFASKYPLCVTEP